MSIKYDPREFLKKIAPAKKIEKLVTGRLTLNKAVLSFLSDVDFISKPTVERTALRVIQGYKEKFQEEKDDGVPADEAKKDAVADKKLLVQRVENSVVKQVASEIKDQYRGEYYKWLPSDAVEPDPVHQLNYGRKFQIGKGEMPGDREGCKCGMLILVKGSKLEL